MQVKKMAEVLRKYVEAGHGSKNIVIELDGSTAENPLTADVSMVRTKNGYDKLMLIQPKTALIAKEVDRDKPMFTLEYLYPDRKMVSEEDAKKKKTTYTCPKCESPLRKTDRYCAHCGQRVFIK